MEKHATKIIEDVNMRLQTINIGEYNISEKAIKAITYLEGIFNDLKQFVSTYHFKDENEEILFFKILKPKLFSKLIYYRKIYTIELMRPNGSFEVQVGYLKQELDKLKSFFDKNIDLYKYYRSNCNYLDKYYFLRGKPDIKLNLDSFYFERDPAFSTSFDYKVSKLLANEMMERYLNEELLRLESHKISKQETSLPPLVKLTWTGSKTNLIELIYALESTENINNGKVTIKELAQYLEIVFNIDLGDIYRTFIDLRDRKNNNRTLFLNTLVKALSNRMDEIDNK